MVAIKAFISLETSVAATMRPEWVRLASAFMDEVRPLIEASKWHEIHALVDNLDLRGLVDQQRNRLEELAVSAFLFGAHHVSGDVKQVSFVKDERQLPPELKNVLDQLVIMIEHQGADLIRDEIHTLIAAAAQVTKNDITTGDIAADGGLATPEQRFGMKPLYVRRPLQNPAAIIAWAKAQGFKTTLPAEDMHVTVCFSRTPIDWQAPGSGHFSTLIAIEGARSVKRLGEAVVLTFENGSLEARHQEFADCGASWDHDGYHPHVTISYDPDFDVSMVLPYQGLIELGREVFATVEEDWKDGIKEEPIKKAEKSLAHRLNEAVLGTGGEIIDLGANLTTSRLVSFGFLSEATQQGVTAYQVNEVLDDRTCKVCQYMHGKEFKVSSERARLMQAIGAQDPQDLASTSPWPGQSNDALQGLYGMSPEEMQAAGFGSPPYHPGCRGVLVMTGSVDENVPMGSLYVQPALNALLDGLKGPAELGLITETLTPSLEAAGLADLQSIATAQLLNNEVAAALDKAKKKKRQALDALLGTSNPENPEL